MPAVSQVHTDSRQTFKVVSFESKLSYEKSMDIFFLPPPSKMPFPRRLEIRETFDKWRISNHDRIRDFSLSLYFYSRHEKILVSLIMLRV